MDTSQPERSALKAEAPANVPANVLTLDTSQLSRSPLKARAL
jgi:hypothetical protein